MISEPDNTATRDARLDGVVAEYLQAVEAGEPPARQAWLARYPELATELTAFFADCDAVERVAVRQRSVAPALPTGDPNSTVTLAVGAPVVAPGTQVRYFGDYEVLAEIARGGMGVVFRARQVSLNRLVAVKMILSDSWRAAVQPLH